MIKPGSIALISTLLAAPLLAQSPARAYDYAAAMRHEHAADRPVANASAIVPREDVVTEEVTYGTVEGKAVKGFLAKPAKGAKGLPGIVMVHEWWGLNDNIKAQAKRLAGEGYTVLAVDLFNGKVATTPDSAMAYYQGAMKNVPAGQANVESAVKYLHANGAKKVGSIGWCFGGHWSLQTGLVGGSEVNAVVVYYGAPIQDKAQLDRLKAPLIGFFGTQDKGIPADSVKAMDAKLKELGKNTNISFYDANHAFANPSGQAYNKTAAEDSWTKALAFYAKNLK
jgi:carboxymethylenebutenolidase